jgi:hypothetical protein
MRFCPWLISIGRSVTFSQSQRVYAAPPKPVNKAPPLSGLK